MGLKNNPIKKFPKRKQQHKKTRTTIGPLSVGGRAGMARAKVLRKGIPGNAEDKMQFPIYSSLYFPGLGKDEELHGMGFLWCMRNHYTAQVFSSSAFRPKPKLLRATNLALMYSAQ